jgi:hypothetical protein
MDSAWADSVTAERAGAGEPITCGGGRSGGVPEAEALDLFEVGVEGDEDGAGLDGLGGDPDIVDRQGSAGLPQDMWAWLVI